jgi:MFS family permease
MSIFFSSKSKNMTPIADRDSSGSRRSLFPPSTLMFGSNNSRGGNSGNDPAENSSHDHHHQQQHLYVLPVLLLEFLALALTRAVLPALLLHEYGDRVYLVMGAADFLRGLLAFFTCPVFGKLSDLIGRRTCLFVTVLGTCAPVCSLAIFSWDDYGGAGADPAILLEDTMGDTALFLEQPSAATTPLDSGGLLLPPTTTQHHTTAITVFIILFALSGVFSSTFTLVFAYISDTVHNQEERVSAYGLALATFGLSFTLGPIIGEFCISILLLFGVGCILVLSDTKQCFNFDSCFCSRWLSGPNRSPICLFDELILDNSRLVVHLLDSARIVETILAPVDDQQQQQ